ncbi:4-hydroxythreonine-4-phosphate dehydrogenase PdxA [Maricaulis sp.]|uniref:4-hydroxythreonine-4-phosphate dehydrogenase PdxA n=1 Tax=Maricaulis sp. TaxID=1486257 RepID=UPI002B26D89E|nr:4-hydroxythreonine-4-phosphate dehydrogenase PdxA [Maricaulis sp.]
MPPLSPVAVSMGDPAGIGPEIILKAWHDWHQRDAVPPMIALGDIDAFAATAHALGLPAPQPLPIPTRKAATALDGLPVFDVGIKLARAVRPGSAEPANAACIKAAIETGVRLCLDGQASALVTAPIAKSVMYEAGFAFPGHTEFLAELCAETPVDGPSGPAMMLSGGGLRVVLVTIHEPLARALSLITPERVDAIARLTNHALRHDFGIASPRLALAGLNPHAGEGGNLGTEEVEHLNPLAERLRQDGINISDARPPDTLFHAEARAGYDAAICLYHDQGLIPVKTLDFHGGVNITLGLPIVRTSPDHGTAFTIAGQGLARPDSLLAALEQAVRIAECRA